MASEPDAPPDTAAPDAAAKDTRAPDADALRDPELFEQAMRHAAIGMALVTAEGRFLEVNAALCRMLGRDEATLRQLLLRDITHPDDLEESFRLVGEMVAGRREAFQREKRYIHANGHLIWGQVSVSCLCRGEQCLFIVQIVDVSEARRQRLILAEQEHQYRLLAENAADVVCRLDRKGRMNWLSPSLRDSLGWRPEQLLSQPLSAITAPEDQPKLEGLQPRTAAGPPPATSHPLAVDLRLRCADGSWRWMSVRARPVHDRDGQWTGWISSWRDIQPEVEMRGRLNQALHTDPLTGLMSRGAMLGRISAALAQRDRPTVTAVLSVGIDRLAQVNHALTHRAGDLLIATVASRLVQALEQPDQVARGTGDTFIVLLDQLASPEEAGAIAERLRLASKGRISYEGHAIEPSVSIGLAIAQPRPAPGLPAPAPPAPDQSGAERPAPEPPTPQPTTPEHPTQEPPTQEPTADELLRDATLAMREAASQGRDRCAYADPQLASRAQQSLRLQEELRNALANGELQAWFMPLVDLGGGTPQAGALRGFEALVRWPRPEGHLEMPDTFLPIARSCQLASAIDLTVLRQSIAALAKLPPPLSVAANLGADTLDQPDLVERVRCWLEEAGVAPGRLHLEITETALIHLGPAVTATIQGLAGLGVRWLVDDFGTGFSSISHLRDLPIHGLKLDRSFTEGLRNGDQKSVRLAQALAGLAEGLGLETVAEGIESAGEAASLRDLGWRCGQGWYFGKAAPLSHWQSAQHPAAARPATAGPAPGGMGRRSSSAAARVASPPATSRSSWALAVTDNVPVGLFALRLSPTGQPEFQFVSRRWLEMLQLEREQVMDDPTPLLTRVHPEDRAGLIQRWQEHVIRDEPLRWEGRLQIAAKQPNSQPTPPSSSWVLVEATPLPQADGSRIWQGVMSDITDRKRQELHLRRILDEAPIAIAIQELEGENPKVTYVNQQFIRCFGYDLNTIPHLADWARLAYPDPQQRQTVFQAWDAAVARARSGDGAVEPLEVKVSTADGSVRDGLFSAVVVGQELVISFVDITAWRQAERELERARTAAADAALAITEAIPVGTYTMVQPPDGGMASFSFMSERFLQICGLNREEAAADPFKAFACVHPDDYDAWVQLNAETFAHKRPFYGECRVVANGELRWISAESVPRDLPDGSTVWEGVLIDISQQKEALDQLQRERTLLNTVLTHIDAQVYMKDRQGRYLYANPSTEKLLTSTDASVIGRTDAELLPAETAQAIRQVDEQVFRQSTSIWCEEHVLLPEGGERIFLSEKLIYRQPGQPDCLIGFSTEITALRLATAQLAASEEHFRLLAENSSDVVFRLADDGRILWVSPSLTTALGWQPEEWIGQVGTDFLVHRGEADYYCRNRQSLRQGAEAIVARDQVRAKDGSIHWIETHAGPYRNARGEVDGIVASFRLIDEERAAEQQLQISEERYRLLAENARDVIWTMEADGRISYISPSIQLLRGLSPEEAMAQTLEQIHPPESRRRAQAYFHQLRSDLQAGRQPQPFRGELEYLCKDGSTIWADVIALPKFDEQGLYQKLLGVSRDISERKQYERQLTIANQQLQELAITDGLTGISNRRHLETLIQQAMERSDRYGEPLTLILGDIDHFKSINDRFGHQAGDLALIEFCRRIGGALRSSDSFGRWGGEEFLILMPQSDGDAGLALAEKLRQRVTATPFPQVGTVTASFGVAQRRDHEPEADWFRRVDELLYGAKQSGRNRVLMA